MIMSALTESWSNEWTESRKGGNKYRKYNSYKKLHTKRKTTMGKNANNFCLFKLFFKIIIFSLHHCSQNRLRRHRKIIYFVFLLFVSLNSIHVNFSSFFCDSFLSSFWSFVPIFEIIRLTRVELIYPLYLSVGTLNGNVHS